MARILVTGATGYIGARLVPRLLLDGHQVRVLARSPEKLRDVPWASEVEIVQGDLTDYQSVLRAGRDMDVFYYLVHAMTGGKDFEQRELQTARNVVRACRSAGIGRIVYLGGLHPESGKLSKHLGSRAKVGEVFLESGIPSIVLQAGVVIGSGSASFEMIRHLTEVLPVMPAPKWVRNRVQPISVLDVIYYLIKAAGLPADVNRAFDIGGPRAYRYDEIMNIYGKLAGLPKRLVIALPVMTPWLAAQWVNLVTPIPRSLAVPLVESLQYDAVVKEHDIDQHIPHPPGGLITYEASIELALEKMRSNQVESTWAGASLTDEPWNPLPSDPEWSGHKVFTDVRTRRTTATIDQLWAVVEGIGGANGWYSSRFAWGVRGFLDKVTGGVGSARGRRDRERLHTGEAVDFWRVEEIRRGEYLRLRAEMKVPGKAWLEFKVEPLAPAEQAKAGAREPLTVFKQRAVFFPSGLAGRLYWYSVLVFHEFIFKGMTRRITERAARARREEREQLPPAEARYEAGRYGAAPGR